MERRNVNKRHVSKMKRKHKKNRCFHLSTTSLFFPIFLFIMIILFYFIYFEKHSNSSSRLSSSRISRSQQHEYHHDHNHIYYFFFYEFCNINDNVSIIFNVLVVVAQLCFLSIYDRFEYVLYSIFLPLSVCLSKSSNLFEISIRFLSAGDVLIW